MDVERSHPGMVDRAATVCAWLIAVALFLTVGWFAMAPDDPRGAVSVLSQGSGLLLLLPAAALSAITAAICSLIAGRIRADSGTFAVSIGLATLSVRGGTARSLWLRSAELPEASERGLALRFALETVGWFGVMLLAMFVSAWVMRRCFAEASQGGEPSAQKRNERSTGGGVLPGGTGALDDVPVLSDRWFRGSRAQRTPRMEGLRHLLVVIGLGLLAMSVLSTGLSSRSIKHGQVCFVVAASVWVACYVAHRFTPVRSAFWSVAAVPLIACSCYLWASVHRASELVPPNMPASHFLRVLPMQYIAVGTAAALAAYWHMHPLALRQHEGRPS